jgi:hypothetical protein
MKIMCGGNMKLSTRRIVTRSACLAVSVSALAIAAGSLQPARAVPSFAAQTGQACQACHIGAEGPQLTPYGRNFKIKGYTITGGTGIASQVHFALWTQEEYSNIQKSFPPSGITPDFAANNNIFVNAVSLFYSGKLYDNVGAFLQMTWDNVGKALAQDNSEIRVIGAGKIFDLPVDYGVSFNNAPGWSDPWNSNYLWGYPYISNGIAPGPNAAPILDGAVQDNSLGIVGYGYVNQNVYADFGGYVSQPPGYMKLFGEGYGPGSSTGLEPWASLTYSQFWGNSNAHIGVHYFYGRYNPTTNTRSSDGQFGHDTYSDVMISNGYQYIGDDYLNIFTLDGFIDFEAQDLKGSSSLLNPNQSSSMPNNNLTEFRETATYYYKDTYGIVIQWDKIWGNRNQLLYNTGADDSSGSIKGSPNSTFWNFEVNWVPFGKEDSFWRPFINARIGFQYTLYTQFNGSGHNYDGFGRNASDNNTAMLYIWDVF